MSALILIVEDERDLLDSLEYNLRRDGYETRRASTGAAAFEWTARDPVPDLIILDLMLPDMQGTEICRLLRQSDRTRGVPVIMLTAKGSEIDRIVGFEVGADDYVVKPFSVRELMLRVRTLLRRTRGEVGSRAARPFGRLRIDTEGHRVWVDGDEVELTALEFRLLAHLLERRGKALTRESLLDRVWGLQADVTTRTVDTHIRRLRGKLGPAGAYIETLRGVGYRIRSEPDEGAP